MIAIIDYDMGNLRSIQKAFERIMVEAVISSKKEDLNRADGLILPGVGHFAQGMQNLHKKGLIEIIREQVLQRKKPILGICLGMQLLTNFSDEGFCAGLAFIDARTAAFNFKDNHNKLKVPHMGWNTLQLLQQSDLLQHLNPQSTFYFVHSYYVSCIHEEEIIAQTDYGISFTSCIQKENIYGTQFHPEKSHKQGLTILKNFARISHVQA
jgi:glutamine amidotransferase